MLTKKLLLVLSIILSAGCANTNNDSVSDSRDNCCKINDVNIMYMRYNYMRPSEETCQLNGVYMNTGDALHWIDGDFRIDNSILYVQFEHLAILKAYSDQDRKFFQAIDRIIKKHNASYAISFLRGEVFSPPFYFVRHHGKVTERAKGFFALVGIEEPAK